MSMHNLKDENLSKKLMYFSLFVLIFIIDINMPLGVAVGVLYALPCILYVNAITKSETPYFILFLCTLLIISGFVISDAPELGLWKAVTNRVLSLIVVIGSTIFNTHYKRALDLIEKAEINKVKLAAIIASTDDAVISKDLTGIIQSWNLGAEKMYGYSESEVIGKSISIIIPKQKQDELGMILEKVKKGDGIDHFQSQRVDKNGNIIDVSLSVSAVKNSKGKIVGAAAIARDISDLVKRDKEKEVINRKLEEEVEKRTQELASKSKELIQSQKMEAIGRLAGGVAHDFNNKLAAITLTANVAMHELDKDSRSYECISDIKDISQMAAGLVNQLLAFSRKQILNPKVNDLNDIVKNSMKMIEPLIRENIKLDVNLCEDDLTICVDEVQIGQVILNLVVNARDAISDQGIIRLNTGQHKFSHSDAKMRKISPGKYTFIEISDDGQGMDKETLTKIFEPFFTTKDEFEGTGLGLATVDGIVKQSKGYIWVYSEKGTGTVFKIFFPLAEGLEKSTISYKVKDYEMSSLKATILLTEDDPVIKKMTSEILIQNGHSVYAAEDGLEGLELFRQNKEIIDLVLTDVIMPKMSGKQLADEIFKLSEDVPIVFISGYGGSELEGLNQVKNPNSLLRKPVEVENLLKHIDLLLTSKTTKVRQHG